MTPGMAVVGLDVSLNRTGMVRLGYDRGDLLAFRIIKHHPKTETSDKYDAIYRQVREFLIDGDDVAIEGGISHRNGDTTRKLAGAWAAAVLGALHRLGTHPMEFNNSTVKKCATGNGAALKPAVTAAAVARWGVIVDDPDLADAAWVAECGRLQLLEQFPEGDEG